MLISTQCFRFYKLFTYFILLGRMGNSRSALKMIMEELQDVDKATEFAKEQDDGELWEDLILYSIDNPRKQDSFLAFPVYFFVECYCR